MPKRAMNMLIYEGPNDLQLTNAIHQISRALMTGNHWLQATLFFAQEIFYVLEVFYALEVCSRGLF